MFSSFRPMFFVVMGLCCFGIAALLQWGFFLGRLPGDVFIERPNFRFYFPLTSCLLVSFFLQGFFFLMQRQEKILSFLTSFFKK
jgi:hypothetical protein